MNPDASSSCDKYVRVSDIDDLLPAVIIVPGKQQCDDCPQQPLRKESSHSIGNVKMILKAEAATQEQRWRTSPGSIDGAEAFSSRPPIPPKRRVSRQASSSSPQSISPPKRKGLAIAIAAAAFARPPLHQQDSDRDTFASHGRRSSDPLPLLRHSIKKNDERLRSWQPQLRRVSHTTLSA